jgi:hypothetical protein
LSSASSSRSRFPIVDPAAAPASENNDDGDDDIRDNVRGRRNGARTGGDDTAATTTAARGGGNSPPRRNDDGPPRLPLHRRPPAAGHAASRRCNPNGRSIPLLPPTPRHGPSSPFAIVNARTGGTETAAAQGGLALRILAHDKHGEGTAMTMMMTEFEKSPDDNQPPRGGAGRGGSRESAGAPGEGLRSGGAQTTISRGWGSQPPRRGRGSQPQHRGWGGRPGRQGRKRVDVGRVVLLVLFVVVARLQGGAGRRPMTSSSLVV